MRRYTLSRTSCSQRQLGLPVPRQNHLYHPALSPALLAAYGMGFNSQVRHLRFILPRGLGTDFS